MALPAPLPPETRTVGQLVAESVRFYSRRFWPSLATGVGPALLAIGAAPLNGFARIVFAVGAGSVLATASYVWASAIVAETPPRRALAIAFAGGLLAFLPVPFLATAFVLPAVLWLALVGLVVPVAVLEQLPLRAAFRRAVELARADYVHAAGSLATLAIVVFLCQSVLFFLLRGAGAAAVAVAAFLANLVVSPLLFVGGALLYFDQAARVRSKAR